MSDNPVIKKGARITGGERTTLADDLKAKYAQGAAPTRTRTLEPKSLGTP